MTVKQARKILGSIANSFSDEELLKEVSIASYIAELVWSQYHQNLLNIKQKD